MIPTTKAMQVIAFLGPQDLGAGEVCPSEITWIPAGETAISAGGGMKGEGFVGKVLCDEDAAKMIIASFEDETSKFRRVWLDFNHEDGEASAWVKGFYWDGARGIVAKVNWSENGKNAILGRAYYSFSPAFLINK